MHILGYCREGFERDTGLELSHHLGLDALGVRIAGSERSSFVASGALTAEQFTRLKGQLRFEALVFPRQILWAMPVPTEHGDDRAGPLVRCATDVIAPAAGVNAFSELWFETPDTNEGKSLARLGQKLKPILERGLNRARLLPKGPGARHLPRLHVLLVSYDEAWLGFSERHNSAPWPMGIPRLKLPQDAPSRSTLKLEEAFHVFLSDDERGEALKSGMTAVDLGAAPGGWSYQFVRRGIEVTAVDNGAMAPELMATGLVTHLRADALSWLPAKPVDWLVCDVVEQPKRIADLVAAWLSNGLATRMVFNLKLPMKKCFEEVQRALDIVRQSLPQDGRLALKARQLYHDRKEVTVYVGPRQT